MNQLLHSNDTQNRKSKNYKTFCNFALLFFRAVSCLPVVAPLLDGLRSIAISRCLVVRDPRAKLTKNTNDRTDNTRGINTRRNLE